MNEKYIGRKRENDRNEEKKKQVKTNKKPISTWTFSKNLSIFNRFFVFVFTSD